MGVFNSGINPRIISSDVILKINAMHSANRDLEVIMRKIEDPSRNIEIIEHVDVLVVGGGMTGVAAALSAARMGAKVLIIEQFNCLGGVATSGWHNHLSQFNAWASHERVVGGIAYELSERLVDTRILLQLMAPVWILMLKA